MNGKHVVRNCKGVEIAGYVTANHFKRQNNVIETGHVECARGLIVFWFNAERHAINILGWNGGVNGSWKGHTEVKFGQVIIETLFTV